MQLSIPPGTIPPQSAEFEAAVGRVRKELRQETDPRRQSLLLAELATLSELTGDDHRAAADLLTAVNADAEQLEPLEHLLSLLRRRQSKRNVPRLLERLRGVSTTDDSLARAYLATAEFAADVLQDPAEALPALQQACVLAEGDPRVWLAMQLRAGGEAGALQVHVDALARRSALSSSKAYRFQLELLRSEVALRAGDFEAATGAIRGASAEGHWSRLADTQLERIATRQRDRGLLALALRPAQAYDEGAPGSLSRAGSRDTDRTARALLLSQWESVCLPSELALAQMLEQGSTPAQLALLLSRPEAAPLLAPLPLSPSLRALSVQALAVCNFASPEAQPNADAPDHPASSWLLGHSLALSSAENSGDLAALAAALEAFAEFLEQPDSAEPANADTKSAGRYRLLAAMLRPPVEGDSHESVLGTEHWELSANDAARSARLLAARQHAHTVLLEGGEALLTHTTGTELSGLLFEQVRRATQAKDPRAQQGALEELEETMAHEPKGTSAARQTRLAARLVRAYSTTERAPSTATLAQQRDRLRALLQVADLLGDESRAFTLRHWVHRQPATEAEANQDTAWLEQLLDRHPEYAEGALELFRTRHQTAPDAVARWFAHAADSLATPALGSALRLAAAVLAYRAKDPERAQNLLRGVEKPHGRASLVLLSWGRRLCDEPGASSELAQLDLEQSTGDQSELAKLRRACALVVAGQPEEAQTPLRQLLATPGTGVLGQAGKLLWALLADDAFPNEDTGTNKTLSLVREMRATAAVINPRPSDAQASAPGASERWAKDSQKGYAALHWLISSVDSASEEEIDAREYLAGQLEQVDADAIRAGACLVKLLHGRPSSVLTGHDPAIVLANLEQSPPTSPPKQRAAALADSATLFSHPERGRLLLLSGYNWLFAGENTRARAAFLALTEEGLGGLPAWEGLRRSAGRLGDRPTEANACQRLAALTTDTLRAAAFLRRRARLLFELNNREDAAAAIDQAVSLDPRHKASFDMLVRVLRMKNEHERIVEVTRAREAVLDEGDELASLLWERARSFRALGLHGEALAEAKSLELIEGERPQTWLLLSELYLSLEQKSEAAQALATLSSLPGASKRQQLMAGVAAADLYEKELGDASAAASVLAELQAMGVAGLVVIERLARVSARAQRWELAREAFLALSLRRATIAEQVEAARIAFVIARDQLKSSSLALETCERLLERAPADAEAIDYLLSVPETEPRLLAAAERALRESAQRLPEPDVLARLARTAQVRDNKFLRYVCVGALAALGQVRDEALGELEQHLPLHLAKPTTAFPADMLAELAAGVHRELSEVLGLLQPALSTLYAPPPESLSSPLSHTPAAELNAWAKLFGFDDMALRVSDRQQQAFRLFVSEKKSELIVGHQVNTPLSPRHTAELVGCLFDAATDSHVATLCSEPQCAALLEGARLLMASASGPTLDGALELRDQLEAVLSRKSKTALREAFEKSPALASQLPGWWTAVVTARHQAIALIVPDISHSVGETHERGAIRTFDPSRGDPVVLALIRFVLSPEFVSYRARLGATHD